MLLNPSIGDLRVVDWGGDSLYDALEVQVTNTVSHGFQMQGSYTWGKNIDTGSASVIGEQEPKKLHQAQLLCPSESTHSYGQCGPQYGWSGLDSSTLISRCSRTTTSDLDYQRAKSGNRTLTIIAKSPSLAGY